jgi:hypothetical protein
MAEDFAHSKAGSMIVQSPAWALVLAAASWLAVAVLGWQVRRWL